jgi:hypothetical protein
MGDRCTVYVTCSKHDAEKFEQEGFVPENPNDENDTLVRMWDEQANYAATATLEMLAGQGLIFHGSHGPGTEYGPGVFASDGRHFVEAHASSLGDEPVCRILKNGRTHPIEHGTALEYHQTLNTAKKLMAQRHELVSKTT